MQNECEVVGVERLVVDREAAVDGYKSDETAVGGFLLHAQWICKDERK